MASNKNNPTRTVTLASGKVLKAGSAEAMSYGEKSSSSSSSSSSGIPTPYLPRVPSGGTDASGAGTGDYYPAGSVPPGGKILNPTPKQPGYVKPPKSPDFGSAGKPFAEVEKSTYEQLLKESSGYLDSINAKYKNEKISQDRINADALAEVRGSSAAGGMGGSGAAGTMRQNQVQYNEQQVRSIEDKRTNEIGTAMQTIRENATTLADKTYQYDTALKAQAKLDASDFIKQMGESHQDWNKFKSENPQEYAHLADLLGSSNYADAMYVNSIPKANILNTTINGSTAMVVSQDPVTGVTSAHSYDLGIAVPKSWTMEKIGTNAVVYHDTNWNPTDPKTYQIFAIDPLTGLPTTQIGGDENPQVTKEKGEVSDLSQAISNVESGGSYTAVGPVLTSGEYKGEQALGKYQIVPGAWFEALGLDPKSEEDKQAFLADSSKQEEAFGTVMGSLIRQYGSTEKAVAAYFGGGAGAKAYGTPAGDKITDGNKSINQYVKDVMAGLPKDQTGSANSSSITDQAGISLQVFNYLTQGVSSMSRLAPAQRNQIMKQADQFLNSRGLDVSTFQSQYKTYNDVLSSNITRQNKTQIMEKELLGTVDNLKTVVKDADLKNLNVKNVAKIFAGQQVNDSLATQYAFHFQQLKNELAGYFAASQGKNSPDVIDNQDAANAVVNGMATGSLEGFRSSIENSTTKMKAVLDDTVSETRKQIWDLFGVGDKYQPTNKNSQVSAGSTIEYQGKRYSVDANGDMTPL